MNLLALCFFSLSSQDWHSTFKILYKKSFSSQLTFPLFLQLVCFILIIDFSSFESNASPKKCRLLKSNQKHLRVFWNSKSIARSYQVVFKSTSFMYKISMRQDKSMRQGVAIKSFNLHTLFGCVRIQIRLMDHFFMQFAAI